ncbi:hypothetical protein [Labedella endophytica]|uniref:Uncharacterized protein n=1 Tax=Labedella endophytica TaxID=1523160 RepID=A0A433JP90_9MICO|nr:hypothetical protein [Labedella endophytica]RUQ97637.1 hypothetical protein ELQ94_15895 [Labedella endophytica]
MFGRRRRAKVVTDRAAASKPTPTGSTPERASLTPDDVYDLVNRRVAEALGPDGRYSLVLRSAADTDAIFSQLASRSLSLAITQAIVGAGVVPAASHLPGAHERTVLSPQAEHTAVAVWADPMRHDPDTVDPSIVAPDRATGIRADTIPLRAVAGA